MVIEAKAGVVAGGVVAVTAIGAWSSRFVTTALQASGITVAPDLAIQLVMTAVMIAIAFATLRSEGKSTRASHDKLSKKFEEFERTLNQVVTDLAVLSATIGSSRQSQPRQRRQQPSDDAEDV